MWKDWELIDQLGIRAGASEAIRKKWRQRGTVSPKWRLAIMAAARKLADDQTALAFDAPPEFELRAWGRRHPRRPSQDARE